ncbi:hypothetical protein BG015_000096 [Linnemannia schmuckeri]|uniref:Uncharacterized protein n=1 Tax=Linnemannia schmuckeri TaxID=64567 RepID=A0A9P5V7U5_9FUNG|nr:hypothetical protein BG015_000096 [Linnemannia schmuckeri]
MIHTDEESIGKDAAPSSRILVLLSSDTDISSNVVVPDTAITTTLGTNDTLETIAGTFPQSPFFNPATALLTQSKHSRDHPGILQPSRPDDPFGGFQQPSQQSNVYRSQDRMDDSRSKRQPSQPDQRTLHPYGGNDVNYNRARRHSHTGLVEFDHSVGPSMSGPRLRARQSMSLAAPYQHQPFRTPRLLRGAFRKARKEQSPLLTSASFGTDYAMQNPTEEWEGDDIFLPWKTVSSIAEHPSCPSTNRISTSPKSLLHGDGSLSHLTNPRGEQLEGEVINNKNYADFDSIDSGDDIELDGDNENINNGMTDITTTSPPNPPVPPKRGHRDSSEIVDVDGLSDEEMVADESSKAPIIAHESPTNSRARIDQWLKNGMDKKTLEDRTDLEVDLENNLDPDMNTILGMASDTDLVMPKFDDNYLQDLNTAPALIAFTREHSSVSNAVSPSCSHSPSTTITCISSHSSPSPSVATGFPRPTAPTHAGLSPLQPNTSGQRTTGRHSAGQALSSFHRDIDILRRHREELKESPELPVVSSNLRPAFLSNSCSSSSNLSTVSSSSSPPLTTEREGKPASQGPIYFKPSHHSLPDRSGPGEQHLHQNVMIIQSNQWGIDTNKGSAATRAFSPQPLGTRGNKGNHIYMARESSPSPPPPPLLDKSAIMTTHNISLATANMNVLTPQEVQEDYYTRRNMRLNQQRQRRRSSAAVAAAAAAATAATMMTSGVSTENRSLRYEGVSPLTSASSSSSSSSRSASVHGSDLIHPFDINNNSNSNKLVAPVPAIGATILPPSYYIPPSAFRTEAAVAAEKEREMERKRKEEEEALKDSFLVFPSPTPS